MEQRLAMDKLREIVADFETDNARLSRAEVAAARALLRHGQPLPRAGEGSATRRRPAPGASSRSSEAG